MRPASRLRRLNSPGTSPIPLNLNLPPPMKPTSSFLSLSLGAFLALGSSAFASFPLVTESFDGTPNWAPLNALPDRAGWASPFKADPALTQDPTIGMIERPGLDHPGLRRLGHVSKPGALLLDADAKSILYRRLEKPINWNADGVYFISFLTSWTGNHASSASRIQLMLGYLTSNGDFAASLTFGLNSTEENQQTREHNKMHLRISASREDTSTSQRALDAGDTYLVVVRIRTSANAPDGIDAIAYPSSHPIPQTEPGDWPTDWEAHINRDIRGQHDILGINCQTYLGGRKIQLDELRIGTTWQQVILGR